MKPGVLYQAYFAGLGIGRSEQEVANADGCARS